MYARASPSVGDIPIWLGEYGEPFRLPSRENSSRRIVLPFRTRYRDSLRATPNVTPRSMRVCPHRAERADVKCGSIGIIKRRTFRFQSRIAISSRNRPLILFESGTLRFILAHQFVYLRDGPLCNRATINFNPTRRIFMRAPSVLTICRSRLPFYGCRARKRRFDTAFASFPSSIARSSTLPRGLERSSRTMRQIDQVGSTLYRSLSDRGNSNDVYGVWFNDHY